ncbi:MAG: hypothetical protein ACKO7G_13765 [Gammaproteobacteria bacterium]
MNASRIVLAAIVILPVLAACGRAPAPAPADASATPPAVPAAVPADAAALPAAAPEQVVADLYAALASLRPSGAPTDAQRATLSPLLSAELTGLLQRANAARSAARAAAPSEKPPFTDGDLFSSIFEGPTGYAVGRPVSGADVPGGRLGDVRVPVTLTHAADAAAGGKATTWTDTALLREENGRFVVADIVFGGDWDFANKGSMTSALRAGLGEAC